MEDQSTEEVLSQLEEVSEEIRNTGARSTMVGSLDVRAMYPSLRQKESARIVSEMVQQSEVEVGGLDYRSIQVFCASNMLEDEIKAEGLTEVIPKRSKVGGVRPGPTTTELAEKVNPDGVAPRPGKWAPTNPEQELSKPQKRQLLATAVRLLVILVFSNHLYQFVGEEFRKLLGGPIGLRLTSVIARIVMVLSIPGQAG